MNFEETFIPIVKWSNLRVLIARVAQLNHKIHYLKVKTTFLYWNITDEIYMA
jgi:hypothetical protein